MTFSERQEVVNRHNLPEAFLPGVLLSGQQAYLVFLHKPSQPWKKGPVAARSLAGQQPYLVSLHELHSPEPSHSKQPWYFLPWAAITPSGQQPNLEKTNTVSAAYSRGLICHR